MTQDGPSHLYTATVVRDLVLHSDSAYASLYTLQRKVIPNWTTAILLATSASIAGPAHAEQIVVTLYILIGFFAFSYARRALNPQASPWSPLTNFILQTWFLWIGFHNFYLGMMLCPLVIGYYVRHSSNLSTPRTLALAALLILVFFTHPVAAMLSIMALTVVCLWTNLAPALMRFSLPDLRSASGKAMRAIGVLAVVLAPTLILAAVWVNVSDQARSSPEIEWAWSIFPMHVFATSAGRTGRQELLVPGVLFFIVVALLAMRRREWASPRGGVAFCALLALGLYLIAPNRAFGGDEVKIRFAWALFLFGILAACSAGRLRRLQTPISIYVALLLGLNLLTSMQVNAQMSRAVDAYASTMNSLPPGAGFVRLRYPTPAAKDRFGFSEVPLDPLFHVDAYVAASRGLVDLSDYQAPAHIFPVVFRPQVGPNEQSSLWALEGPGTGGAALLTFLRGNLPVPIDYVVVIGEEGSAEAKATDMEKTMADLSSNMRLISTGSFIRVYQRIGPR